MPIDFSGLNDSCLSAFGQEFSFTRIASLAEAQPDDPLTFTGILETGVEVEGVAPGEGSTYARLWGAEAAVSLRLQKGDEIPTTTTIYKIVDIREDAGRGLWLLLRKDRDAI